MNDADKTSSGGQKLAAFCGLYCGACSLFIASTEDPARLEKLSAAFKTPPEALRCLGCRSDKLSPFCRDCGFKACAKGRGTAFCSECGEFPCADLTAFQKERPHRLELWNDLERIKEAGAEVWMKEKRAEYACPECGTINSAYDLACRKCGTSPSCAYVRKHRGAVETYFRNMKQGEKA